MPSEIERSASFSQIRYAQCWEDADILLKALDIQPDHTCLSIASAGDNTLAMLSQAPKKVIAIDLSLAQIACLELRVAAYRELTHPELLVLIGSRNQLEEQAIIDPKISNQEISKLRIYLYQRCRSHLSSNSRQFWDERQKLISEGIGTVGKFEHYLALFRRYILPLIHDRQDLIALFSGITPQQRQTLYQQNWGNWRSRLLFKAFFSRFIMGKLGRDPSFFHYVKRDVAEHILERTHYAVTILNPAENPYLQWIVMGQHLKSLPYALRPENFEPIRNNLDKLEFRCMAIEDFLKTLEPDAIDSYNLSNIFEFMSVENSNSLLTQLVKVGRSKARLVYWNLLAERHRPELMADCLQPLNHLARQLYQEDKVFFYSDFIVEEII